MAKESAKKVDVISLVADDGRRPRLKKLTIKNFRCIGPTPVEIDLDEIVVLVGPNNVGKSSILRAYELVMKDGSKESEMKIDDFPNGKIDPDNLPEIQLDTVVFVDPGKKWLRRDDPDSEECYITERWIWNGPGKPTRQGFDVEISDWSAEMPWGAPNIANSRRPEPHKVDAFADPIAQAKETLTILADVLKRRVEEMRCPTEPGSTDCPYKSLLETIANLQKRAISQAQEEIDAIEAKLTDIMQEVFPGFQVEYDPRPEEDLDKCVNLFKADAKLLMGPQDGYMGSIEAQGSGAQRTLLWAALRMLSEHKRSGNGRPHVLLFDEPELCLHPNAIREACRVLYELPTKTGDWQVMVTTHSPAFVDVSRDNTTIVRVELTQDGSVKSTTVFRPDRVQLSEDERELLKLLNICDPYVAEFFFGGRTVIVEGDTEYTAFKRVIAAHPEEFKDIHIIRARGKATIVPLAKILNQFGTPYAILHDSDTPTITTKKGEQRTNGAWTVNTLIQNVVKDSTNKNPIRLLASVPNFEGAFFGGEVDSDKPYNALVKMSIEEEVFARVKQLLKALVDEEEAVPMNCVEWSDLKDLHTALDTALAQRNTRAPNA